MKINNFTKCTLAIALGFGLNSLTVVEAADNTTGTTSETINKSFIEQFPFAEKFTDKDGITAVRMKSPDVPLVNKEKGYSKEIVRVINYKQGAKETVINRIYQYVRFYGAPVHEIPKDSPVNDVPEYTGGSNPIDPPVLEKPEYNGGANPIDPPVLEKPELEFGYKLIDPPVLEKPEFNGGVNPIDPPILEKPELKVPNTPEVPKEPTPEKPNTPEVPKESTPEKPDTPEVPKESTPEKPKLDKPTNSTKLNPKENKSQDNKKVLPNTSIESSSTVATIGTIILSIIGLSIFKRRNN